ncbi:hypothetical protein SPFM8_00089 [Salmonella phage SPFM8]|nr:hypothetical protein SPFM8_00089 [Salmonella phage SPFM8]
MHIAAVVYLAAALKERLFDTRCQFLQFVVMVLYLSFCATVVVKG